MFIDSFNFSLSLSLSLSLQHILPLKILEFFLYRVKCHTATDIRMSMNYVGSISILDRGDGPAQAIIDKNKRSVAQRLADETKDELEKVMTRVEDVSVKGERSKT